ncbi:MAG: hypothetical protein KGP28_10095 [Bdellovibrionales bacterium]|nr:hypothetical protein [Bdellovibrionales bacterium]
MSKHILVLCACALGGIQAFAQSTTTIGNTGTSVAVDSTTADSNKPKFKIGYLGILRGPGLNSKNFSQADSNSSSAEELENRFRFLLAPGESFDFGIEARITAAASQEEGMNVSNGDYRFLANFRHVVKTSSLDLTLTPRLKLPTSSAAQENRLLLGAEVIANLDIALTDSRFSFNTGTTLQQNFFDASGPSQNVTTVVQPWFEVDYQINDGLGAFASVYPELLSQAKMGAGFVNDSDEIDVGANWEFLKGWTATPYISVEPVGMDASSVGNAAKNMQFNLYVSGALL